MEIKEFISCYYLWELEHTSKTYGDKKKKFQYPAYIAVENAAHKYEYALLTGENQITYISTSFIDKENVKFSEDYLPYDFMTEEGRAYGSGYSIYVHKKLLNGKSRTEKCIWLHFSVLFYWNKLKILKIYAILKLKSAISCKNLP